MPGPHTTRTELHTSGCEEQLGTGMRVVLTRPSSFSEEMSAMPKPDGDGILQAGPDDLLWRLFTSEDHLLQQVETCIKQGAAIVSSGLECNTC